VEEAIRLQQAHGGDTIALTMGPESSQEALKTCLAMGCTEAVQVTDTSYEGSDTLGTARVLAAAIEKVGDVQVALFGRQAIDGDTGQTIVQTARKLGWTPLTYVAKIREFDPATGTIIVDRLVEEGRVTIEAKLPVVISVVKEINEPRYPSFMGIRKASRAKIPVWTAADLEVDGDTGAGASQADWSNVYALPERETAAEIIAADTVEEGARILADRLFEEKVI
jgi:electron transfer flavoprotein beta subunit